MAACYGKGRLSDFQRHAQPAAVGKDYHVAVKEYALSLPEDVQDLYWRSVKSSISQTQRQVARKIEMTMPTLTMTLNVRRVSRAQSSYEGMPLRFTSLMEVVYHSIVVTIP
jgi:hypothetical protein